MSEQAVCELGDVSVLGVRLVDLIKDVEELKGAGVRGTRKLRRAEAEVDAAAAGAALDAAADEDAAEEAREELLLSNLQKTQEALEGRIAYLEENALIQADLPEPAELIGGAEPIDFRGLQGRVEILEARLAGTPAPSPDRPAEGAAPQGAPDATAGPEGLENRPEQPGKVHPGVGAAPAPVPANPAPSGAAETDRGKTGAEPVRASAVPEGAERQEQTSRRSAGALQGAREGQPAPSPGPARPGSSGIPAAPPAADKKGEGKR